MIAQQLIAHLVAEISTAFTLYINYNKSRIKDLKGKNEIKILK